MIELSLADAQHIAVTAQAFNRKPSALLSPFDNLIRHRERTKSLWNFDYTLECYVP